MQLELWKAMHGMVIPMPFLKDIPEADMKSFREIYDDPKRIGNWRKIVLKMPLCLKKYVRKRPCVFWNMLREVCLRSWVRWPWYFITVPAGTRALPKRKICWQFWLGETIRMRCIALSVCWRLILKALTTAVCQCLKGSFTGIRRDWKPVERDGLKNAAAVIEKRSD